MPDPVRFIGTARRSAPEMPRFLGPKKRTGLRMTPCGARGIDAGATRRDPRAMALRTVGWSAVLVLVAGALGVWLRGVLDETPQPQPRTQTSTPEPNARRIRSHTTLPPRVDAASSEEIVEVVEESAAPSPKLIHGLGIPRDDAIAHLPELLERARANADDHAAQILLGLAAEVNTEQSRRLVLDAMLSNDIAYEFGNRDGYFFELFRSDMRDDVGPAAIARLRFELARGESGAGSVGGYAMLVGLSGMAEGRVLLEELRRSPDGPKRGTGIWGLAASGDPALFVELAREADFGDEVIEPFLRASRVGGLTALRTAVLDAEVRNPTRGRIAMELVARGGVLEFPLMARLWDAGHPRAAIYGYSRLNQWTDDAPAIQDARDRVYAAIEDDALDGGARRGAFYAVEYQELFQTERAATILTAFLARSDDRTWARAARAALRQTQKRLGRLPAVEAR